MQKYKIQKELGKGMWGTTYLVKEEKTGKKYALKIEKVLSGDLPEETNSYIWKEINFFKNFTSKHPKNFITLKEYWFDDTCDHKQKHSIDPSMFGKEMQKLIKETAKSKYCCIKVMSLVDGSLENIMESLSYQQLYSMMCQMLWAVSLMHSNGYIHGDLHSGNVGYIKTEEKTVKCFTYNIPTYGYRFLPIDYGNVCRDEDNNTPEEKNKHQHNLKYEFTDMKSLLVKSDFWDYLNKRKIKTDRDKTFDRFRKTDEYKIISRITTDTHDQLFLFEVMYPEKYQKAVLGRSFKKYMPSRLLIPNEDIFFMLHAGWAAEDLFLFFKSRLI